MRPNVWIPHGTRAKIPTPAAPGGRNHQMVNTILPLVAQGLCAEAIFAQFRSMYAADVSDREIRSVIEWAIRKNPKPFRGGKDAASYPGLVRRFQHRPPEAAQELPQRITENWLGSFRCDETDLSHTSPWRPLEDWRFDALMLVAAVYDKEEYVNVVTDFTIEQKDGGQKANPKGAGRTLLRDEWMRWIRDQGTPQSEAGAWVRPNPVKEHGSGKGGASTDADVTSFRFCLLESDILPVELQLSLLARLPLPVAAIIDSGGRSIHAWVMLNCANAQEYRVTVDRIYRLLARFGLCPSNKNASRLSRLPGAQREIGKHGDGAQRLLYLNPEPAEAAIFPRSD